MRTRIFRTPALAAVLSLLATFAPAAAGAAVRSAPLSDAYCEPFGEFYTITVLVELQVALFEAFSQSGDATEDSGSATPPEDDIPDADQLRASSYGLLAPKMAAVSGQLANTAPKVLKPVFRQQRDVFERGVELLREAGFTDVQIEAIADANVNSSTAEVGDLTGDVDLDDQALETLANDFLAELEVLELADLSPKAERALDRSSTECGVTPSSKFNCTDVLPETEAAAILGDTVTLEESGCNYTGPEPVDGLTPEIEVVIYDSVRALNLQTSAVAEPEDVAGIGDEAVSFEGFSADGHAITCGRTLVAADGDRTVVVALCLGGDDPEVTDDQLVEIANGVLERIA
ncbi:MAG: hypothetical protein WD598_11250 [Acidimicrobiia bacterium]